MADPIDYLIVRDLQTALRGIAVSSGYHSTVAAVAVKLDPDQDVESLILPDGQRPLAILAVAPEAWDYAPANQVHITWPITVHWIADSDPTDDTSRMHAYLCGCADVERAIAIDSSRGGRAVDTRILKRAMDGSIGGAAVWAVIELEVSFHRTFGAPDAM